MIIKMFKWFNSLWKTLLHTQLSLKKKPPLHLTFLIPRVLWVSESFSLLLHYQPHFVEIFCSCFLSPWTISSLRTETVFHL